MCFSCPTERYLINTTQSFSLLLFSFFSTSHHSSFISLSYPLRIFPYEICNSISSIYYYVLHETMFRFNLCKYQEVIPDLPHCTSSLHLHTQVRPAWRSGVTANVPDSELMPYITILILHLQSKHSVYPKMALALWFTREKKHAEASHVQCESGRQ